MQFTVTAETLYKRFNTAFTKHDVDTVIHSGMSVSDSHSNFGKIYYLLKYADLSIKNILKKIFENGFIHLETTLTVSDKSFYMILPGFIRERRTYSYYLSREIYLHEYNKVSNIDHTFEKAIKSGHSKYEEVRFNYKFDENCLVISNSEVYFALDNSKNVKYNFRDTTIDINDKDVVDCPESRLYRLDQFG